MKIEKTLLLAALLLGTVGPALANNHVEPGKGPPDCPGTPGAFISDAALELVDLQTPPGEVVTQIARNPDGRGAGDAAQEALVEDCGIGALPQEE